MRFTMRSLINAVPPLALLAVSAAAEPPVDQVGASDRAGASRSQQIVDKGATGHDAAIEQTGHSDKGVAPPEQLPHPPRSGHSASQLVERDQGGGKLPPQLSPPDKHTEASEPLTARAEGRITRVVPVEGRDRCAAVAESGGEPDAICASVIESRAEEFARPDPAELSPEQRLLAEQPRTGGGRSVDAATRRLANDGDPSSRTEQGVAATAIGNRPGTANGLPDGGGTLSPSDLAAVADALGQAPPSNR